MNSWGGRVNRRGLGYEVNVCFAPRFKNSELLVAQTKPNSMSVLAFSGVEVNLQGFQTNRKTRVKFLNKST